MTGRKYYCDSEITIMSGRTYFSSCDLRVFWHFLSSISSAVGYWGGRPANEFVAGSESGVIRREAEYVSPGRQSVPKKTSCDAPRDGSEADALRWPLREKRVRRPRWIKCARHLLVAVGAAGQSNSELSVSRLRDLSFINEGRSPVGDS